MGPSSREALLFCFVLGLGFLYPTSPQNGASLEAEACRKDWRKTAANMHWHFFLSLIRKRELCLFRPWVILTDTDNQNMPAWDIGCPSPGRHMICIQQSPNSWFLGAGPPLPDIFSCGADSAVLPHSLGFVGWSFSVGRQLWLFSVSGGCSLAHLGTHKSETTFVPLAC